MPWTGCRPRDGPQSSACDRCPLTKSVAGASTRGSLRRGSLGPRARLQRFVVKVAPPRIRNPRVRVAPGTWACRHGDQWHIVADRDESAPNPDSVVAGDDIAMPDGMLRWQPAESGLPVGLALSIRRRRGGERIRPLGRGCTKTVKALFQEAHVPPWQRADWPLLYCGEQLVAVPGLALAAEAVVASGCEPRWSPRRTTD